MRQRKGVDQEWLAHRLSQQLWGYHLETRVAQLLIEALDKKLPRQRLTLLFYLQDSVDDEKT